MTPPGEDAISAAADRLRHARRVAVLTGAGVSAESGIPTFRDTMAGLWREFDPRALATPEAFERDPETVTRWYDWRRVRCAAAEPNPAHLALARLEREVASRGGRCTLLTQNVDGLHHKAGSRAVVELHGSIRVWRCTRTGRRVTPPDEPFERFPPPSAWGGVLRPDVVWFGEMLPEHALREAAAAAESCDAFLSVGTSAVVYPAAGLVEVAARRGAATIEVNPEPTPLTPIVDVALRGAAGACLPRLVDRAFGAG